MNTGRIIAERIFIWAEDTGHRLGRRVPLAVRTAWRRLLESFLDRWDSGFGSSTH